MPEDDPVRIFRRDERFRYHQHVPLSQVEINDGVLRLLDGHVDALQLIRDGVANGEIVVQAGGTGLHLRALPPDSPLTRALEQLRIEAGQPMHAVIAQAVGVSVATVSRLFGGSRVSTWPTVRLIVEYLGGNPADYRQLWEDARSK